MSTQDSKNGLSNRGRPRLEVSPRFNGEESEFCPQFTPYAHAPLMEPSFSHPTDRPTKKHVFLADVCHKMAKRGALPP
jgi:hypothetical protein